MNSKTLLSFTALLILSALALFLVNSENASAQNQTAEDKCYNKKLRAASFHMRCLLKAQANTNRGQNGDPQPAIDRCNKKFERRFNKAESQAAKKGAMCPSHGNMVTTDQNNKTATTTANTTSNVTTLTINIDQNDITTLMSESLNLNIAIKVNGSFNVLWRSVSEYLETNQFQWSSVFHIFGAAEISEAAGSRYRYKRSKHHTRSRRSF